MQDYKHVKPELKSNPQNNANTSTVQEMYWFYSYLFVNVIFVLDYNEAVRKATAGCVINITCI